MVKYFGRPGKWFNLALLVKRRRAMLASNPLRNSQCGTHRGRWAGRVAPPGASYSPVTGPTNGRRHLDRVYKK